MAQHVYKIINFKSRHTFWTKLKERVREGDGQSENVFFRAYLSAIIKNVFFSLLS